MNRAGCTLTAYHWQSRVPGVCPFLIVKSYMVVSKPQALVDVLLAKPSVSSGFASQNEGIAESARSKVRDGERWFQHEPVTKGTAENAVPASSCKQYQEQKHN